MEVLFDLKLLYKQGRKYTFMTKKAKEYKLTAEQSERVYQNMKFVYYLVNKQYLNHPQKEDLEQIGMIGLIKATVTFDESKGIKFSSYASRCILNEINMFFRTENRHTNVLHWEDVVNRNRNGDELTLADITEDANSSISMSDIIEEEYRRKELEKMISIILNKLLLRESCAILFTIAGFSQREIGDFFGVSRSMISRISKEANLSQKTIAINYKPANEFFKVSIETQRITIIFSTESIENLQEFHSQFLAQTRKAKNKVDFTITYQDERAIFQTVLEERAFEPLAMLVMELDKFGVKHGTLAKKARVKEQLVRNRGEKEKSKSTTIPKTSDRAKLNELAIQNYAIQLKQFSLLQIKEQFLDNSILEIAIAINRLLRRNVIYTPERGVYRVV